MAQQNNTRKLTIVPTRKEPGETICIDDITRPFPEDLHRNKYMVVACDYVTTHSWSKPIQMKTEIGPFAVTCLGKGINVRRNRFDNSGENWKYLTPLCKKYHQFTLELTGPHSPQYNGRVERCIADLWLTTQVILNAARLTQALNSDLWSNAWKYVEDTQGQSPDEAPFSIVNDSAASKSN
jgi:hypothetical protein